MSDLKHESLACIVEKPIIRHCFVIHSRCFRRMLAIALSGFPAHLIRSAADAAPHAANAPCAVASFVARSRCQPWTQSAFLISKDIPDISKCSRHTKVQFLNADVVSNACCCHTCIGESICLAQRAFMPVLNLQCRPSPLPWCTWRQREPETI